MLKSTKVRYFFIAIFVVLLGILVLLGNISNTSNEFIVQTNSSSSLVTDAQIPTVTTASVVIGQTIIPVELATTTAAVQKGLSGRTSLDSQSGMLFVFAKPDRYRFWMPDMRFPLDIIWINNGKVVDISENVSNKFDPANPNFYTPSQPAQYVLEVNAGFAASKHIQIGDTTILNKI